MTLMKSALLRGKTVYIRLDQTLERLKGLLRNRLDTYVVQFLSFYNYAGHKIV